MSNKMSLIVAIVSVASSFLCNACGRSETLNGHEWVDLGLPSGTKWATCNIGATSPKEYGDYFAWGEIKPKSTYTAENYMYFSDPNVLPASADAATVNWGKGWRMPTIEEAEELYNQCTWTWMSDGYKVVGPNGNGIFLPAAANRFPNYKPNNDSKDFDGFYWTSSFYSDSIEGSIYAWCLYYSISNNSGNDYGISANVRIFGQSVRPVCK